MPKRAGNAKVTIQGIASFLHCCFSYFSLIATVLSGCLGWGGLYKIHLQKKLIDLRLVQGLVFNVYSTIALQSAHLNINAFCSSCSCSYSPPIQT